MTDDQTRAPGAWSPADYPLLEGLVEREVLSVFDRELALALAELAAERRIEVLLGIAFASAAVQAGHTCADIARLAGRTIEPTEETAEGTASERLTLPHAEEWLGALRTSAVVTAGGAANDELEPSGGRPLVLDAHGRLYLERYHAYERRLADSLLLRAARPAEPVDASASSASLGRLFPASDTRGALQRVAAEVFLHQHLTVVSGGPGTGKTFTVAKALALLQEQALAAGRAPFRVLLTAPTGKAAQRLGDAIRDNLAKLGLDAAKLGIPTQASTLHRALGFQPSARTHFKRHAQNPLPDDVVVVDEASMVDLALMAKLVDAVRPEARLLLLGDKDQLASVEAGAILSDIYAGATATPGSATATPGSATATPGSATATPGSATATPGSATATPGSATATHVSGTPTGLAASLVHLTESHRFGDDGAILALAQAVNAGDVTRALAVLADGGSVTLARAQNPAELQAALAPLFVERWRALAAGTPTERLELLDHFRVLAAHRRGPFGVEGVNTLAVSELARREYLDPRGLFYDGRPVIAVANDYDVGLFNGDAGVIAPGKVAGGPLRAWFRGAEAGTLREVSPSRLPRHETAFALSVHKSQGSEFDEVVFVLPERVSPVLTRELVYTAVTRARRKVTIVGSEALLRHAITTRVERASGLAERLWGDAVRTR